MMQTHKNIASNLSRQLPTNNGRESFTIFVLTRYETFEEASATFDESEQISHVASDALHRPDIGIGVAREVEQLEGEDLEEAAQDAAEDHAELVVAGLLDVEDREVAREALGDLGAAAAGGPAGADEDEVDEPAEAELLAVVPAAAV